jgi:hypothetical protein
VRWEVVRQADRFHGKSGTQKGTTTEILRNSNLSIKTPKKSTDEQTSRQQISFSGTLYSEGANRLVF